MANVCCCTSHLFNEKAAGGPSQEGHLVLHQDPPGIQNWMVSILKRDVLKCSSSILALGDVLIALCNSSRQNKKISKSQGWQAMGLVTFDSMYISP